VSLGIDFDQHNAEVAFLWDAYAAGSPPRVPVILGANARYFLASPEANPEGMMFRQYSEDPDVMLRAQVRFADWARRNLPQDVELGPPSAGWDARVDFQNYYEAAWFGCSIQYLDPEVPDTTPAFSDETAKRRLLTGGPPAPFDGLMARNLDFHETMCRRQREGFTYLGKPIRSVTMCGLGTDGPFTVACNLRGATEMCLDLLVDPGYARELLAFITEATIARITAFRSYLGEPVVRPAFGFADDSIQSLSEETYAEFVLPCHRRLVEAFADPSSPLVPSATPPPLGPRRAFAEARHNSVHLCGDASRLFPLLARELGIRQFDTGYPIGFAWVRSALGSEAHVFGGPRVELLRQGPADAIAGDVRRILSSGVTAGRRFVLREANNLAPGTPVAHLQAMYDAAKLYGRYE
jgi:uroporphyrinogen-III decarboxylase